VMRGWAAYFRPVTEEHAQEARQYFEQALAIDGVSVDAKVGIATILAENVIKRWSKSPEEDVTRAEQLLLDVLERNRNHARAHFAIGTLARCQGRLVESQIALERAIAL